MVRIGATGNHRCPVLINFNAHNPRAVDRGLLTVDDYVITVELVDKVFYASAHASPREDVDRCGAT